MDRFFKVILFFALIFSSFQVFSSDFFEINKIVTETRNRNKIDSLYKAEKNAYEETGKLEHQLNLHFIDAFKEYDNDSHFKKMEHLLWIVEHANFEYQPILMYANYHLAAQLVYLNSYKTAKSFADQALKLSIQSKKRKVVYLTYSILGSIEYYQKKYNKAIEFYSLAYDNAFDTDYLFKASMLNNVSLCKMGLNDLNASNDFIFKSLQILKKAKENDEVKLFQIIVEGNLGSNYFKQKKYNEAILLLEKELDYYQKRRENLPNAFNPINELIQLYKIKNDSNKLNKILLLVKELEATIKNKSKAILFTKVLYSISLEKKYLNDIEKYGKRFLERNEIVMDSVAQSIEKMNSFLYDNKVQSLRNEFASKNTLLNETLKTKKRTNWFLGVVILLVSIIFILVFIGKSRRERKNRLISIQQELIQESKRQLLENEIKLKQEKITSLAINLTLKKDTERAFLDKIREIKRKKNPDLEAVIKELQMSVTNLLQIDSNSRLQHTESEEENNRFYNKIKEKHPDISKQDLLLCSYFRLNLNSKEIAQLTNMTSGTIRVYKTKLKAKLGLETEQNLDDYLSSFDSSNTYS